jgi:hypothetical protein
MPSFPPNTIWLKEALGEKGVGENKGVRTRKTTFLHQCARNWFLTPYPSQLASHFARVIEKLHPGRV